MWGLTPHENCQMWWGARAIFRPPNLIDIPFDRQQMTGGTEEERKKLGQWINEKGIPGLRKELEKQGVQTNTDRLISVDDRVFGYFIMANPKGSYGHLYITAAPYSDR